MKLLCRIGFHDWDKWLEQNEKETCEIAQHRKCKHCGILQTRVSKGKHAWSVWTGFTINYVGGGLYGIYQARECTLCGLKEKKKFF